MQIRKVVLYSLDGKQRPVAFQLGKVNIITGRSETGKSALLPILEYCLGSSTSKVPVNVIRDSVSWYAVHLQFSDGLECYIARREPGHRRAQSAEMYLKVGLDLESPAFEDLAQNASPDSVSTFLSDRLGIATFRAEPERQSQPPYRIRFTHTRFFNYQDQNEIANKSILFHRQAEEEMPRTIREVLPFFLGAVDEERLIQTQRLRLKRQELRRLAEERSERIQAREAIATKAVSFLAEAAEIGLVDRDVPEPALAIDTLRLLVEEQDPSPDYSKLGDQIAELEDSRAVLVREQRVVKEQLRTYRSLVVDSTGFSGELGAQKARLQTVGLLNGAKVESICPLCESHLGSRNPTVDTLVESIRVLDSQLDRVSAARPRLDEVVGSYAARLADIRVELRVVQSRISRLEGISRQIEERRSQMEAAAFIRGRISSYLETVGPDDVSDDLEERFHALTAAVEELAAQLAAENVAERLNSILSIISQDMSAWTKELKLEYRDAPIRVDASRLTVAAETRNGPVFMDQIGSGSNWLGFHLVTFAALHKWFAENDRPVPRFLVIDQPTQAYYDAQRLAGRSDDATRVEHLYDFILSLPDRLKNQVQIIVVDHEARNDEAFMDAVIADWHTPPDALVPSGWPRRDPTPERAVPPPPPQLLDLSGQEDSLFYDEW